MPGVRLRFEVHAIAGVLVAVTLGAAIFSTFSLVVASRLYPTVAR